jgi:hypothetical protein
VLIHYHGGVPKASAGVAVPREIEAIHLANGWSGVGYNFVVDQEGVAYEGRGWNLIGAHCPGHNTTGIGIYIGIGADQTPSDAALRTARALYDEACQRTGKQLTKSYHGFDYATECPGPKLIAWVKAGMVAPELPASQQGDPLVPAVDLTPASIDAVVDRLFSGQTPGARYKVRRPDGTTVSAVTALSDVLEALAALKAGLATASADIASLKAAVAAIPGGGTTVVSPPVDLSGIDAALGRIDLSVAELAKFNAYVARYDNP